MSREASLKPSETTEGRGCSSENRCRHVLPRISFDLYAFASLNPLGPRGVDKEVACAFLFFFPVSHEALKRVVQASPGGNRALPPSRFSLCAKHRTHSPQTSQEPGLRAASSASNIPPCSPVWPRPHPESWLPFHPVSPYLIAPRGSRPSGLFRILIIRRVPARMLTACRLFPPSAQISPPSEKDSP